MKFKHYLRESYDFSWVEASISTLESDVQKYFKINSNRTMSNIADIKEMYPMIVSDTVYKVDYDKFMSKLKSVLEDLYNKVRYSGEYDTLVADKSDNPLREIRIEYGMELPSFSIVSFKKAEKISKKYKDRLESAANMHAFVSKWVKLSDFNKAMKPKLVSGRKPTQASIEKDKKTEFKKQMASKESMKQVIDTLNGVAQVYIKKYESEINKRFVKTLDSMEQNFEKTKDKKNFYRKEIAPDYQKRKIWDAKYTTKMNGEIEEKSDWKNSIMKLAEELANDILSQFVAKNTSKLAVIVGNKNNLKDVSMKKVTFNGMIMENVMTISFQDGAGFTVYTKTEISMSKLGKWFYRFPTRFTNVTLSTGKTLSSPSEEKMDKEFM